MGYGSRNLKPNYNAAKHIVGLVYWTVENNLIAVKIQVGSDTAQSRHWTEKLQKRLFELDSEDPAQPMHLIDSFWLADL